VIGGSRRWVLFVALVLAAILPALGAGRCGAECVDYRDYMRWVGRGSMPLGGETDVAVSAGYAYVTWEYGLLTVLSLEDPVSPRAIGFVGLAERCNAALAVGEHVFVAADDSGLVVVDVSSPASPRRIGSVKTPGRAFGVASEGDYVYVADYSAGLQVIAAGDLATPVLVGSAATPDVARAVAVSGAFAYVADTFAGLLVFDVSDPTQPRLAGQVDTPGRAYDVTIADGLAYVADLNGGLQIVDVRDPAHPRIVGSAAMPGEHAHRLAVRDGVAFVTTTDPLAEEGHLQVVDVSDPTVPRVVGAVALFAALGIDLDGAHAYVNNYYQGLEVVDISHLQAPRVLEEWRSDASPAAIESFGSSLLLVAPTESTTVLSILDPWGPSAPTLIGSLAVPEARTSVGSLDVPETRTNSAPFLYGDKVVVCSRPAKVKTLRDLAVLLVTGRGPSVVCLTDPTRPRLVGPLGPPRGVEDLDTDDRYLYLVRPDSGLVVYDLNEPSSPRIAGRLEIPGFALGVAVRGNTAFVTSLSRDLVTVDVTDPHAPRELARIGLGRAADRVAVSGDLAVLSSGDHLLIVDIADPGAPILVSSLACLKGNLRFDGTRVYVAARTAGLIVIDTADPSRPSIVGSQTFPGNATDVEVFGGRANVVDCTYGLRVFPTHCAGSTLEEPFARALQPAPNPTRDWTAVPFRLPEGGTVTLEVADVAGRRIRRIPSGIFPRGEHRMYWDGQDDAGRPAASGVYQLKLTTPGGKSFGRVVRIE
jgi:hypothetical protein